MTVSMSWLSGKPVRTRSIVWDPAHTKAVNKSWGYPREGTSVLNGLILCWFAFTNLNNEHKTAVYITDTRENKSSASIILDHVADLDFPAHGVVLVGDGFASTYWRKEDRTIILRLHSLNGAVVRECTPTAFAVYGQLRVFESAVSICIASGDPLPQNISSEALQYNANHLLRFDVQDELQVGDDISSIPHLLADTIMEWDTVSGVLRTIKIPQIPDTPLLHSTQYTFLSPDRIVLAGVVDPSHPVLASFPARADEPEYPIFSAGTLSEEFHQIGKAVAIPGSTEPSDIVVHPHGLMTVFRRDLLTGIIPNAPVPPSPEGLHLIRRLPNAARILNHSFFSVSGLPSVSGNRILAYRKISRKYVMYILDFDQARVGSLITKDAPQRTALHDRLSELDARVRVRVVTRSYHCNEEGVGGGFQDAEYSRSDRPPAWSEHIRGIERRDEEERRTGIKGGAVLEFDEAPEEHRDPMPFGFVQSALFLGRDVSFQDVERMAITTNCVVLVPEPGQDGLVYDFVE